MNEEDEAFADLERRLAQQRAQDDDDIQEYKKPWVGLTRSEFKEAVEGLEDLEDCWIAIEAKLKQKNT